MDAIEALLQTVDERYPCREVQSRQLAHLTWPTLPGPATVVVHGLEATGKSGVVQAVLRSIGTQHVIVNCHECITARHLLELTVAAAEDALAEAHAEARAEPAPPLASGRCESMSMLVVHLQRLLQGLSKFVLVFDGIDHQREAPATLLPALARLGEMISNLTVLLVITIPRPRFLHAPGIPYVHFTTYTRQQALTIVSANPLPIADPRDATPFEPPSPPAARATNDDDDGDSAWLWPRFCEIVWDTLAKGAANDIVSFRSLCERLWRPFVAPVVDGTCGARNLSRLLVLKRDIFKDESVLSEGVVPETTTSTDLEKASKGSHDLPLFSKYLLCAAYLASYNPARQDPVFFMRSSERKRRKKGGGTAAGRARGGVAAKHRKIQRKLLGPQAFVMERMLAILHAILPFPIGSTSADIQTQIATLSSLRLLIRASATADVLEAPTKWRVNVGWDYMLRLSREVGLDLGDYLAD